MLFFKNKMQNLDPPILEKIRRNALIELLKFMCTSEFPARVAAGDSDDQIYSRVKELIMNGDIKTAVKFLTKKNKNKFALLLAQSVNST